MSIFMYESGISDTYLNQILTSWNYFKFVYSNVCTTWFIVIGESGLEGTMYGSYSSFQRTNCWASTEVYNLLVLICIH